MLTIKKLVRLVFMAILPILLYEVAALTFWSYMMGTAPLKRVHEVAWSQDLVIFLPVICIIMFGYHLYRLFIHEPESKIDVRRYERPKYEKYLNHHDLN